MTRRTHTVTIRQLQGMTMHELNGALVRAGFETSGGEQVQFFLPFLGNLAPLSSLKQEGDDLIFTQETQP